MVSAYPKPIKIFKNTAIKVSNFPFDPNLKIKIYSLNSYIGNIIPQFTNTKDSIIKILQEKVLQMILALGLSF